MKTCQIYMCEQYLYGSTCRIPHLPLVLLFLSFDRRLQSIALGHYHSVEQRIRKQLPKEYRTTTQGMKVWQKYELEQLCADSVKA